MGLDLLLANLVSFLCGLSASHVKERCSPSEDKPPERASEEVKIVDSRSVSEVALSPRRLRPSPLRADEEARLQRLCELQAMGVRNAKHMDDITVVLGWLTEMPIVLVSMVTAKKLCFQSRFGIPKVYSVKRDEHSLCAWCISKDAPEVLIVEDAKKDWRVEKCVCVTGPPYITFYAGCPLTTSEGMPLGTLCLVDQVPRHICQAISQLLINFAEIVTRNMERLDVEDGENPSELLPDLKLMKEPPRPEEFRRGPRRREQVRRSLQEAHLLVLMNSENCDWPLLFADGKWHEMTNISVNPPDRQRPEDVAVGRLRFWDVARYLDDCGLDTRTGGLPRPDQVLMQFVADRATFRLSVLLSVAGGKEIEAVCRCVPADLPIDPNAAAIGVGLDMQERFDPSRESLYHVTAVQCLYFFIIEVAPEQPKAALRQSIAELAEKRPDAFALLRDVEILQLIGTGSFGRVYLGNWIGAPVAVKVMRRLPGVGPLQADPLGGSGAGTMFEASLSAALSHPNVVQTFEYCTRQVEGDVDSSPCKLQADNVTSLFVHETVIVQEWCDRGSLTKYIQESWPMGPSGKGIVEALANTEDIASGLSYMHSRGIVHGDLSCNNVLLVSRPNRRSFVCKICDFGLARVMAGQEGVDTSSLGTVQYMPAEMFSIDKGAQLSPKVDIHSLGILVWQFASGKQPYAGMSPPQVVVFVSRGRKLDLPPETHPSLATLVREFTHMQPEKRPDSRAALSLVKDELAEQAHQTS